MTWPFADLWERALTYEQFVLGSTEHCGLWTGVYRIARVPAWALDQAGLLGGKIRLVVLAEDWCGDATNTVPILAKWADQADNVALRMLRRDEHPAIMDRYLTNGVARSIPVVIVLTENMQELGWWGPRPRELEAWVEAELAARRDKRSLYPDIRRWYARDKGETTLREVLAVMQAVPHTQGAPS